MIQFPLVVLPLTTLLHEPTLGCFVFFLFFFSLCYYFTKKCCLGYLLLSLISDMKSDGFLKLYFLLIIFPDLRSSVISPILNFLATFWMLFLCSHGKLHCRISSLITERVFYLSLKCF